MTPEQSRNLSAYLNDHLAGSVTAMELLEHVASAYAGTEAGRVATELWADVSADRRVLEGLMAGLGIGQSAPRKASAWLAEKVAQLKMKSDDAGDGALRLLEAGDAVSTGVEGKRLLWRALAAAAEGAAELRGPDYEDLVRRAEDQRQRLEAVRIAAARSSFSSPLYSGERAG